MEEKILKASATGYRPAVARLTTNHINGGVSFICDSLAGWSSKCSFVVYEVDSDGVPIAGTETDWIGSKVNNNLESLTLTAGTDRDYPANLTMVVADETAGGRNKLVDALTTTLEIDGTLKNSIVTEAKIATDAVETAKIKDLNVTAAKLATDAVETAKIKDLNVTEGKLATDAVTTTKIKDLNVTAAKLATDAVETDKIKNGAVTKAKLSTTAGEMGAAWTAYSPISSGFSSITANVGRFLQVGKTMYLHLHMAGTSNSGYVGITLPAAPLRANFYLIRVMDNGVNLDQPGMIEFNAGSTSAVAYLKPTGGTFTSSGTKTIHPINLVYELA